MTVIEDFALVVDNNKRGVQLGIIATGLTGLAIALRSVRPFKKFTTPQSLPTSFIKKHLTLRGRAAEVDPSGLVKVDHYPIWPLPRRHSPLLTLKIDSIQVTGLGTAWLQTVVKGENVNFQPITVEDDALSCVVIRNKKNVGVQLVSLGFASVQPFHSHLQDDKLYLKYYKELLSSADKAEAKKLGLWAVTT